MGFAEGMSMENTQEMFNGMSEDIMDDISSTGVCARRVWVGRGSARACARQIVCVQGGGGKLGCVPGRLYAG